MLQSWNVQFVWLLVVVLLFSALSNAWIVSKFTTRERSWMVPSNTHSPPYGPKRQIRSTTPFPSSVLLGGSGNNDSTWNNSNKNNDNDMAFESDEEEYNSLSQEDSLIRNKSDKSNNDKSSSHDNKSFVVEKGQQQNEIESNGDYIHLNGENNFDNDTTIRNLSNLEEQLKKMKQLSDKDLKSEEEVPMNLNKQDDDDLDDDDEMILEWKRWEKDIEVEEKERKNNALISNINDDIMESTMDDDYEDDNLPMILQEAREKPLADSSLLDQWSFSSSTKPNKFDEINLPPGAIPPQYRKYISDYNISIDGDIELSPEAYQQACDNANPDGSLNLAKNRKDMTPQTIFSPSILETISSRPMAPYQYDDGQSNNEITIEDLKQQAQRSRLENENNPQIQEELHQRIMNEDMNQEEQSDLFNKAMIDPEKAWEFWNQELIKKRQEETIALEQKLDKATKLFERLEQQRNQQTGEELNGEVSNNNTNTNLDIESEFVLGLNDNNRNIYFASAKEAEDMKKRIEKDRLDHARNVARFYRESNGHWDTNNVRMEEEGYRETLEENASAMKEEEDPPKNGIEEEWVLVEDPSSPGDAFYWNSATGEMKWDASPESRL